MLNQRVGVGASLARHVVGAGVAYAKGDLTAVQAARQVAVRSLATGLATAARAGAVAVLGPGLPAAAVGLGAAVLFGKMLK